MLDFPQTMGRVSVSRILLGAIFSVEIFLYHRAANWMIEVSVLLESLKSHFTVDFVQFPISIAHVNTW